MIWSSSAVKWDWDFCTFSSYFCWVLRLKNDACPQSPKSGPQPEVLTIITQRYVFSLSFFIFWMQFQNCYWISFLVSQKIPLMFDEGQGSWILNRELPVSHNLFAENVACYVYFSVPVLPFSRPLLVKSMDWASTLFWCWLPNMYIINSPW